jgi:hypothetical protein
MVPSGPALIVRQTLKEYIHIMERLLTPELLDSLPATHPEACRSRQDLRVLNTAMGNGRWFRREFKRTVREGEAVLEIGAGDGSLRNLAGGRVTYAGLDLAPTPPHWPSRAPWHRTDVRKFEGWPDYNVICGNLVFHHFTAEELADMGRQFRDTARVVLACEPARAACWQWVFNALCPVLQAGPVTRHDGRVSIEAGFTGDELPQWLGLTEDRGWKCVVRYSPTGAYRMVAVRK